VLHIVGGRAVRRFCDQLDVFEQCTLCRREAASSSLPLRLPVHIDQWLLNPQEVSMAIQSIRAPVQIRHVSWQSFLLRRVSAPPRNGPCFQTRSLAQKVRPCPKHLMIPYSLSARTRPPDVITLRGSPVASASSMTLIFVADFRAGGAIPPFGSAHCYRRRSPCPLSSEKL